MGARFAAQGCSLPKSQVPVLGKPILFHVLDSLQLEPDDRLVIIHNALLERNGFAVALADRYPRAELCAIYEETGGAADTVARGVGKWLASDPSADAARGCLLLDGDTFYSSVDIVAAFRGSAVPALACFPTLDGDPPIFSYSACAGGRVLRVAEKDPIAPWANSGAYYFPDTGEMLAQAGAAVAQQRSTQGELYTSCLYAELLEQGAYVEARFLRREDVWSLGTPAQVAAFVQRARAFLFDLDGTLVRTDHMYFNVWKELLQAYGLTLTHELYDDHIQGKDDAQVAARLLPHACPATVSQLKDAALLARLPDAVAVDGAHAFLRAVRAGAHPIAVVTNSNRRAAAALLAHFGFPHDLLVIGSECACAKPHPDPYVAALKHFGLPSSRAVVLEDSRLGILSALAVSPARLVGVVGTQGADALRQQGCTDVLHVLEPCTVESLLADDVPHDAGASCVSWVERIHNSLRQRFDLLRVDVAPTKLKGGYIADVWHVTLTLGSGAKVHCVLKVENTQPSMLTDMALRLDLYQREYYFYESIAPYVEVRAPQFLGLVKDAQLRTLGVLVERLDEETYELNVDLNARPVDLVLRVVERCAALHGSTWNQPIQAAFPNVKKHGDQPWWSSFVAERHGIFADRWRALLSPAQLQLGADIADAYPRIQQRMSAGDLCLCHGDVKSPNLFFHKESHQPVFIDWQYTAYGKGVADIVFLMIESLDVQHLHQWEGLLKEYYYIKLCEHANAATYRRDAYEADYLAAICHFPFFVAMWFGTAPQEDLIDPNFPFFFVQRYFGFLDAHRGELEPFLASLKE
jgi:HAD superfamily hydrolase (TIGR01509 family)